MFQFKYFSHQTRIDIVEGFEGFNDNSPLGNCPHEIPSMTISPGFLSPDKCPWIILPCTTTTQTIAPPPMKFPPGQLPPGFLPPRQLPLNDSPLDNFPQNNYSRNLAVQAITPEWLPLGNCLLDNYPHEISVYINNWNTNE